jgi:hypothetical protein
MSGTAHVATLPGPADPDDLRRGAHAAAQFLLDHSAAPGAWQDYLLPVGASTEWVTAHVAGALAVAAAAGVRADGLLRALDHADEHLTEPPPGVDGWGFNAGAGPDADSTAVALMFLSARRAVPERVLDFLAAHRRPDGGYATYTGPGGWGDSHPCVTPVVALALRGTGRRVGAQTVAYIRTSRLDDGTWPSYWWRGSHYATYWNLLFLRSVGARLTRQAPVIGGRESARICSSLDLACLVGAMHLRLGLVPSTCRVAGLLMTRQRADGGFDGGLDLRVTHHDCRDPWHRPSGQLYRDDEGLLTTAMVLRVLATLLTGTPR